MRSFRTALVSLAIGLVVVLSACGNGPPPDDTSGSSSGSGGGGGAAGVATANGNGTVKVNATDDLKFSPVPQKAKVGDVVEWDNTGSALHNVTFDAGPKQDLPGGGSASFKFTQAGTYKYQCTLHPGMTGEIDVS